MSIYKRTLLDIILGVVYIIDKGLVQALDIVELKIITDIEFTGRLIESRILSAFLFRLKPKTPFTESKILSR